MERNYHVRWGPIYCDREQIFDLPYRGKRGGEQRRENQNQAIYLAASRTGFIQVEPTRSAPIQIAFNPPALTSAALSNGTPMQRTQKAGSSKAGTRVASTRAAGPTIPLAIVPSQATGSGQSLILLDKTGTGVCAGVEVLLRKWWRYYQRVSRGIGALQRRRNVLWKELIAWQRSI